MKKLLILLFFPLICYSQHETLSGNEWVYNYDGIESDTLGNGDSIWYKELYFPSHGDPLKYDIFFDVDSTGGTSSSDNEYLFIVQGKNNESDSYTPYDTVSYAGTADTVFHLTETGTAKIIKWLRLYVIGESDELVVEIQKMEASFYK
jgi:hypothetical protein